jgi:hypothetical protein
LYISKVTRAAHERESAPSRRATRRPRVGEPAQPKNRLLGLQQAAGNRAVVSGILSSRRDARGSDIVSLSLPGPHPIVAMMDRDGLKARMPTFSDLRAAYTNTRLRIPQADVRNAVTQLLGRMEFEHRLKSKEPVATIVAKIFPGPGMISEAEFNKALDSADRTEIYRTVVDADTKVKDADKAKLKALMKDAADLMSLVEGNAAGLTQVFGTKAPVAKARYAAARAALAKVATDLDGHVTTDYNLDDPETFLGGWAFHPDQTMHLLAEVVAGTNPSDSKTVLIHEASHLGDPNVDDLGYYKTAGFEAMSEIDKVNNAAHYEELPRRVMGISSFGGLTFTPGIMVGGAPATREDTVRKMAGDRMQAAWDTAIDLHAFLRKIRKAWLTGKNKPFQDNKALILEISPLCDLTVHKQAAAHARVTTLDITLIESIARAVGLIGELTAAETLPTGPFSDPGAAEEMCIQATKKYGHLLQDPARDKTLLTWLVGHRGAIPVL